jgi:hypothetical protein
MVEEKKNTRCCVCDRLPKENENFTKLYHDNQFVCSDCIVFKEPGNSATDIKNIRCSFCTKDRTQVECMVASGPEREKSTVFICSECVAVCVQILSKVDTADETNDSTPLVENNEVIKNLRENTEILTTQNDAFGFTISSIGYSTDGNWLDAYVEISLKSDEQVKGCFLVNVSLYDENGNLVGHVNRLMFGEKFKGISVYTLRFEIDGIIMSAKKAKIYFSQKA